MSNQKPNFDVIIPENEREDRYHHFLDDSGNLMKTDILTGEVISSSHNYAAGLEPGKQLDASFTNELKGRRKYWTYNEVYRDLICNLLAQGKTFSEITKMRGFPGMSVIAQWRAGHSDFEAAIRGARKMGADFYADKIAESLEEGRTLNKDEIPAEKLYYDKLKWLAEKADPEQYGNRTTIAGDKDAPLTLIVDTGIRRDGPDEIENEIIEGEFHEHKG